MCVVVCAAGRVVRCVARCVVHRTETPMGRALACAVGCVVRCAVGRAARCVADGDRLPWAGAAGAASGGAFGSGLAASVGRAASGGAFGWERVAAHTDPIQGGQ